MKKETLFILIIYLLSACSDSNDFEKDQHPPDAVYVFKELEYYIIDTIKVSMISKEKTPPSIIRNNSSTKITNYNYPFININDGCFFQSDDDNFSHFIRDSIFVKIPNGINNSEIILSDSTYELAYNFSILNPYKHITDLIQIPAKTIARVDIELEKTEYKIGFELRYFDNKLNQEKSLTGICTAYYYTDYNTIVTSEKLD